MTMHYIFVFIIVIQLLYRLDHFLCKTILRNCYIILTIVTKHVNLRLHHHCFGLHWH